MVWDVGENLKWTTVWSRPTTLENVSLNLNHVLPLFILLGAAIVLSITVFGLEILCRMKRSGSIKVGSDRNRIFHVRPKTTIRHQNNNFSLQRGVNLFELS